MLQDIRDNAQGTIAKVIVGLIVVTFALFGVESIIGGFQGEPEVAVVDGNEITESQFTRAVEQRRRQILTQMGAQADPSMIDESLLRRSVLEGMIQERVLLNAAEDKNLVVSDALVDEYIRTLPIFQQNGQFSKEAYVATLRSSGMMPSDFRQAVVRELILQQDREAIRQTAFVTGSEIERLVSIDRQTRDFSWLTMPAERFEGSVEVSAQEVESYYESNQDAFRLPERVSVHYVELNKADLEGQVSVTDEELTQRYQQEIASAQGQEERNASHILIEVNDDRNDAEALEQIQAIDAELKAGADFAELAEKHSDDPGSATAGGDLGYVTPGIFVPEFDEALFSMEPGQVSEPVRTEFGYHLIRLEEVRKKEAPSFEEMRDQLTASLRDEKAEQLYIEKVEQLADVSYSAPDLVEPAEVVEAEVRQSPVFSRQGGEGLFANPRVISAAFSEDVLEGNNSLPLEVGSDRTIVLRLAEHHEPAVQPLAEVEAEIRELLTRQKAIEKASEYADQLIAEYRNGTPLDQIADKAGQGWQQAENAQRGQAGVNPEILDKAFSMARPQESAAEGDAKALLQGFPLQNGQYALILLSGVEDGSLGSFSKEEQDSIKDVISQSTGSREFSLKAEVLQNQADIKRS